MTIFEFCESGQALIGVRLGLITPAVLERYDMYKTYLRYLDTLIALPQWKAAAKAKQMCQTHYDCEYWVINRAIRFFETGKVLQLSVNGHAK